jgi:hypothetical protein
MENHDQIITAIKTFGIPGIMSVFLGWAGKRYLDRKLESEKAANQASIKSVENKLSQSLEVHKQKIKNWEFFFQKQFNASQKLYELNSEMIPAYSHPDMDWHDALKEMANNLHKTHGSLRNFLKENFTVLSPDILEKLESAAGAAEEGMLYGGGDGDPMEPGIQCAQSAYNRIKECCSLLKAEVDGQRLVEFHEHAQKNA